MFEGCVVVVGMVVKALNVGKKTPFEKEGWWMMVGFLFGEGKLVWVSAFFGKM